MSVMIKRLSGSEDWVGAQSRQDLLSDCAGRVGGINCSGADVVSDVYWYKLSPQTETWPEASPSAPNEKELAAIKCNNACRAE